MEKQSFLDKIEFSFKACLKGEENLKFVIYYWGCIAWLFSFFVVDRIIKINPSQLFDTVVSIIVILYFICHIYILKKCSPKKPKLTKEEKQRLKEEARKDLAKKFMRKLFLQESVTKWNSVTVAMVLDAFFVAHFLNYISR